MDLVIGEPYTFYGNRGDEDAIPVLVTSEIVRLVDLLGPPLGCGGSRLVFALGEDSVFKYEHGGELFLGFEDPYLYQNDWELGVFERFGATGILLPVVKWEVDGLVGLKAPRLETFYVSKRRVRRDPEHYAWLTTALKGYEPKDSYQCGWYEGRPVLLDYGVEGPKLAEHFGE